MSNVFILNFKITILMSIVLRKNVCQRRKLAKVFSTYYMHILYAYILLQFLYNNMKQENIPTFFNCSKQEIAKISLKI